jgi:hypothetical protein
MCSKEAVCFQWGTTWIFKYYLERNDPPSSQRGCPTETRRQISNSNIPTGSKSHKGARYQDILTDWPSVVKNLTWPPLWSSGKGSRLKYQRSGFDSRCYKIFWDVVGLEGRPLSLVSTTEEILGRNSNGSGLEIREYGRRDSSRWPRTALYPQKFADSGHGV